MRWLSDEEEDTRGHTTLRVGGSARALAARPTLEFIGMSYRPTPRKAFHASTRAIGGVV
jgi:hypothetical protein